MFVWGLVLLLLLFAVGAALFLAVNARIARHMLADEFTRPVNGETRGTWRAYRDEADVALTPSWRTRGELLEPETGPVLYIGGRSRPPLATETWTPARTPALESDVAVPAAQALITALVAAICMALLTWAVGWSWRVPVAILALALTGAWLWRLAKTDALLWTVEGLTGVDLNRDGNIGRPERTFIVANPDQARAAVTREAQQAARSEEQAELLAFLDRCYLLGTGEHAHGVRASGPERRRYVAARDTLMRLGLAEWKSPGNPRAGWQLTASRHRARQIIEQHVL